MLTGTDTTTTAIKIKPPKKPAAENLKQRAYLNSVSSIIDFAGVQITGLIVSPYIVNGLGGAMYGVWKMLGQMTGYAGLADTRATQALKWTVAKKKDVVGEDELRTDLASAFYVTLLILPLVLLAGSVLSWYAPIITKAAPEYYSLIRITSSLLICSMVLSRIFDLFDAVLRGMNLGFKRMGFKASIVILGGSLKVLVLSQGYGLIGLSVVQIFITLVTGFVFYNTVKKHVPWFGLGKTNFKNVIAFSRLSGWNMANSTTDMLLSNTDKVLLGLVASPLLVSSYALASFLPLAVQGLMLKMVLGMMPGVGKLLGLGEFERINRVRETTNDFIYVMSAASGVVILLFNQSFISAWVGDGFYPGPVANALILLMVIQDIFIKHDGFLITASLDLRRKVMLTTVAAILFLGIGWFLASRFGIAGLCISLLAGKFLLFVGQRQVLHQKVKQQMVPMSHRLQPMLAAGCMLGAACYASQFVAQQGWLGMAFWVPIAFVGSLAVFFLVGLRRHRQANLVSVIMSVKFLKLRHK